MNDDMMIVLHSQEELERNLDSEDRAEDAGVTPPHEEGTTWSARSSTRMVVDGFAVI